MDREERIAALESRIDGLEERLRVFADILAALQPVTRLLAKYGVSDEGQVEVCQVIDEMSTRLERGEMPSLAEFVGRVTAITRVSSSDRAFVALLVEAMKIERPHSLRLYDHFSRAMDLLRV